MAGRNWKMKYLTKEEFQQWKNNDWWHLVMNVKLNTIIILATFGVILSKSLGWW